HPSPKTEPPRPEPENTWYRVVGLRGCWGSGSRAVGGRRPSSRWPVRRRVGASGRRRGWPPAPGRWASGREATRRLRLVELSVSSCPTSPEAEQGRLLICLNSSPGLHNVFL